MADDNISIECGYENTGAFMKIEVNVPFSELKTFTMPKNCMHCPVGFSQHNNCGRNIPFQPEDYKVRPATCKLQLVTVEDVMKSITDI